MPIVPKSMRRGAKSMYFIMRAIGSHNKLGMFSSKCTGAAARSVVEISYSEMNDCQRGSFPNSRKLTDNKFNSGTGTFLTKKKLIINLQFIERNIFGLEDAAHLSILDEACSATYCLNTTIHLFE